MLHAQKARSKSLGNKEKEGVPLCFVFRQRMAASERAREGEKTRGALASTSTSSGSRGRVETPALLFTREKKPVRGRD